MRARNTGNCRSKGFLPSWKLWASIGFLTFCWVNGSTQENLARYWLDRAITFLPTDRDSALANADRAISEAKFTFNDTLLAEAFALRAEAYYGKKQLRLSLRELKRLKDTAERIGDRLRVAKAWTQYGNICAELDSLPEAIKGFEEAFIAWQAVGDETQKARCLVLKGRAQAAAKDTRQARESYLQAVRIGRRSQLPIEVANAQLYLGLLYLETEELELARQHLRTAEMNFPKGAYDQDRASCLRGLAQLGVAEKRWVTAEADARKGLLLAREVGSRSLTMDFYQLLGDVMAGQGRFEQATDYYQLNALVRDSLDQAAGARELSEVVLQFEKEKALLAKEKAEQETKLKNTQLALRDAEYDQQQILFYIILAGMGLALLFGAGLAYAFVQKNKTNRKLQQALNNLNTAQDQLVRSEKLASLGQVTAGIAHEIRNPLNFVNNLSKLSVGMIEELAQELEGLEGKPLTQGQLQLLQEYFEDIKSNAQKVLEHGERASRIVRDMLQHSALMEGERSAFSVNELVEEYMKVAFHSQPALQDGGKNANCDLVFELDPQAGNVRALRPEIGRALLNIMVNAFEAVQAKRESAPAGYQPRVVLRTKRQQGGVWIDLQDNGPGISQDDLRKIFDPFFTTKPPTRGTGLGLSLAHESIVRKHQGKIEASSEIGQGTTFRVFIPD